MLVNAIVVVFDHRGTFDPALLHGELVDYSAVGELIISNDQTSADEDQPVDGQQRSTAETRRSRGSRWRSPAFLADTEEQPTRGPTVLSTRRLCAGSSRA
ncbi:hypothetical protein [Actinokineospora globicatena]|uniref:hypothetical protein n=1 Tax=Actinokineospora globicatena TaxID=103729 RepID=UPI0020A236F9|nr:hypothetical protein [Actinokineospora globicatena]GLW78047.1 hypothetical protein Aglo01_25290 [Actinokineospora globicatena]GLW85287.1 hypothetical protein Aglo02_29270 [Actinokineospora globicatena]